MFVVIIEWNKSWNIKYTPCNKVLKNAIFFLKSCLPCIKVFSPAQGQEEGVTKGVTPKSEYEGWV